MNLEPKRSPLHDLHIQAGARMVDFHGWYLPVQYTSVIDEHLTVRRAAGLFDVSHMGQLSITGPGAFAFVQSMITNDLKRTIEKGLGVYAHLCNPSGGVLDDIFVYGLDHQNFFMVVNSSTREKDVAWLKKNIQPGVTLEELTDRAGFALQGPKALEIIHDIMPEVAQLPRFGFKKFPSPLEGEENKALWTCRTGYTGEAGAEFFGPVNFIRDLWNQFLAAGQGRGLKPCGLGARDTLRLEMGYPLYGDELREDRTSLESNMEWAVKWNKGDFIGRSALEKQKKEGLQYLLMGFELLERGIPRTGYNLQNRGRVVAQVASGTFSPSLQKGIGTAFFPAAIAKSGTRVEMDLKGRLVPAQIVDMPFYKHASPPTPLASPGLRPPSPSGRGEGEAGGRRPGEAI